MYCFFFNDTATTEIYTLSLHDALPISQDHGRSGAVRGEPGGHLKTVYVGKPYVKQDDVGLQVVCARDRVGPRAGLADHLDRKSTRLNSSHANISYAVFCLKKKRTLCRT